MWCTRIAAVFASQCFAGDCEAWRSWLTWVVLLAAAFFALANLPYMARGMQKYEALFMVTIFQGSNIVSNSLSATVVLRELDGEPWWKIIGYSCCIIGMILGLVLLARGEGQSQERTPEKNALIEVETEQEEEVESTSDEDGPTLRGLLKAISKDPADVCSPTACCKVNYGVNGDDE